MQTLVICDAGVIIGFVAADKQELFRDVIKTKGLVIKVPQHVDREILRVLNGSTGSITGGTKGPARWRWLKGQLGEDTVLPEVTFPGIGPVATKFASLIDTKEYPVAELTADAGELFVIAHALAFMESGEEVFVAIDDRGGGKLASARGLRLITTVDIFDFAIGLGLISTKAGLTATYSAVSNFSTLPSLRSTGLERKI